MEVINGIWYMNGISSGEEGCIQNSSALIDVIEDVGFLPLFSNNINGFSVENMTDPSSW